VDRLVIDLTTGEVTFLAGNQSHPAVVRGCAALT